MFETKLGELDIKHIMARIKYPQTNDKLERFHSEIERHLKSFEDESVSNTIRDFEPGDHIGNSFHVAAMTDPVSRLVDWHNNLPHMSLKDGRETPWRHTCASRHQKIQLQRRWRAIYIQKPRRNYLQDNTIYKKNKHIIVACLY